MSQQVVEQICCMTEQRLEVSFYRTAAGAELDMVIETGRGKIGVEIKFSGAPKVARGFWQACEDIGVDRAYVVAPVREGFAFAQNVDVLPAHELGKLLA